MKQPINEPITIIVDNPAPEVSVQQKKVSLKFARQTPEIFRRKSAGLINFWDLGQFWNGTDWQEHAYSYTPSFSTDEDVNEVTARLPAATALTFHSFIFSTPTSQWDSHFKKIEFEEAEKYGLLFVAGTLGSDKIYNVARVDRGIERDFSKPNIGRRMTETNWTPEGFIKPTDSIKFIVGSAYHWALTNTGDGYPWSKIKITKELSFNSPQVANETFKLTGNADIFLMPQITKAVGVETYSGFPSDYTDSFVGKYQFQSRARLLNKVISGYDDLTWLNTLALAQSSDAQVAGSDKTDYLDYFRSLGVTVFSGSLGGEVSASGWPYHPPANAVTSLNGTSHVLQATNAAYGSFLGAIRQSSTWYFFWRNDNTQPGYGSEYNPQTYINSLFVSLKY